jgi:hypothetical protein
MIVVQMEEDADGAPLPARMANPGVPDRRMFSLLPLEDMTVWG